VEVLTGDEEEDEEDYDELEEEDEDDEDMMAVEVKQTGPEKTQTFSGMHSHGQLRKRTALLFVIFPKMYQLYLTT
jgi:hypothetical protein